MRRRIVAVLAAFAISLGLALVASPAATAATNNGHHVRCNPTDPPTYVVGSLGNDRLVGDRCDNIIVGFTGDDVEIGKGGHDWLYGGRGRDTLRAVDGVSDRLNGNRGFDTCIGDQFDSFVWCEQIVVFHVS